MKEIRLETGEIAKVDDEDYDRLVGIRWVLHKGYACGKLGPMHRLVTNAPARTDVDHANHDTLDNRKANLRVCSRSENQWNRGKQPNNKSGYKGVWWVKSVGKYEAQIGYKGKKYHLGHFDCPREAHAAYCRKAAELHGEFANFG